MRRLSSTGGVAQHQKRTYSSLHIEVVKFEANKLHAEISKVKRQLTKKKQENSSNVQEIQSRLSKYRDLLEALKEGTFNDINWCKKSCTCLSNVISLKAAFRLDEKEFACYVKKMLTESGGSHNSWLISIVSSYSELIILSGIFELVSEDPSFNIATYQEMAYERFFDKKIIFQYYFKTINNLFEVLPIFGGPSVKLVDWAFEVFGDEVIKGLKNEPVEVFLEFANFLQCDTQRLSELFSTLMEHRAWRDEDISPRMIVEIKEHFSALPDSDEKIYSQSIDRLSWRQKYARLLFYDKTILTLCPNGRLVLSLTVDDQRWLDGLSSFTVLVDVIRCYPNSLKYVCAAALTCFQKNPDFIGVDELCRVNRLFDLGANNFTQTLVSNRAWLMANIKTVDHLLILEELLPDFAAKLEQFIKDHFNDWLNNVSTSFHLIMLVTIVPEKQDEIVRYLCRQSAMSSSSAALAPNNFFYNLPINKIADFVIMLKATKLKDDIFRLLLKNKVWLKKNFMGKAEAIKRHLADIKRAFPDKKITMKTIKYAFRSSPLLSLSVLHTAGSGVERGVEVSAQGNVPTESSFHS